jgi:REP element-mobilizing transposase RayT
MNRGVDRRPVFFTDTDRLEFGRLLGDLHEEFSVETLAYCLMDNHYHLLVRSLDGRLSQAMHYLGTTYTTRTNRRRDRDGPLFRGRFHSIPVETDTYLTWSARYIHRNPLDVAGVTRAADYRWSSYRTYLGHRRAPTFLDTDLILGLFDHDRRRLAHYTEESYSIDLGVTPVAVIDLVQLIEFEIGRHGLVHDHDAASNAWQTRSVLMLVMDRLASQPIGLAIEEHLDFPNRRARAKAISRARARARTDATTASIAAATLTHLGAIPGGGQTLSGTASEGDRPGGGQTLAGTASEGDRPGSEAPGEGLTPSGVR